MTSILPPSARPAVGSVLEGRYRLIGEVGEGGIGWVFRAEHLKLGHHVAIKMLQAQFVAHDQMRPRFEREAKALAALAHPNVVTLTDYSVSEGRPYLVMELLEGRSLADLIDEGPVPEARARPIIRQILEALAFAHQRGFVHRDLKPDNIFLVAEPPDFVKVLDFGLVKLLEPTPDDSSMSAPLTRAGAVFGTPAYMSPEQVAADRTSSATDVYALGIILYEMLTGERPFEGENTDIIRHQLMTEVPKLSSKLPNVSAELDAFVAKATAKKAANRFENASAMLEAFDALPIPWIGGSFATTSSTTALPREPTGRTERQAPSAAAKAPASSGGSTFLWLVALVVVVGLAVAAFVLRERLPGSAISPAIHIGGDAGVPTGSARSTREPPTVRPADVTAITDRLDETTPIAASFGRSPWTSPSVPLLDEAAMRVHRGELLDDTTERALKDWARAHHSDPRAHLVLGEHYFLRRYRHDAVERLNLAQQLAPNARNDPRMLAILLVIATDADVGNEAATTIVNDYGRAAAPAVRAEIARRSNAGAAANRLRSLLRKLR